MLRWRRREEEREKTGFKTQRKNEMGEEDKNEGELKWGVGRTKWIEEATGEWEGSDSLMEEEIHWWRKRERKGGRENERDEGRKRAWQGRVLVGDATLKGRFVCNHTISLVTQYHWRTFILLLSAFSHGRKRAGGYGEVQRRKLWVV